MAKKSALATLGGRIYSSCSRWWQPSDASLADWRSHVLAFLILVVVSFVMLWLADKLSSQGMAITRYMATVQAPVTGRFYPETSRDQITVVVYDDAFLRENGSAWPIPYGDHADWLMRLVDNSAQRPKAIFLDITFVQARNDTSLAQLQSVLCTLHNDLGIPVFLAALVSPLDGQLHVRADLEATRDTQGRACFTLVSVESNQDPIDRQTWSYPLSTHIDQGTRVAGPAPEPHLPSYHSAAMVMAHQVAQLDLGPEEAPLALVWGATTTPQQHAPEFLMHCRQGSRSVMPAVPNVARQLWDNDAKPPLCPFHHALSMAQVAQMHEDELAPFVAARYLFIGAAVSGQNDFAYSPVHGQLPGVYVHAMALDNLLTYGKQYKQHSEWSWPLPASMLLSGLTAIAAVFLVHLVFRALRASVQARIRQHPSWRLLAMSASELDEADLGTRLLTVPIRLLMWLLRLSLQATAAVLLIAFLQWQFRIGMLPVVELIGMTLLAEGLNYMDKVRLFLFGKTPGAAQQPPSETDLLEQHKSRP